MKEREKDRNEEGRAGEREEKKHTCKKSNN